MKEKALKRISGHKKVETIIHEVIVISLQIHYIIRNAFTVLGEP